MSNLEVYIYVGHRNLQITSAPQHPLLIKLRNWSNAYTISTEYLIKMLLHTHREQTMYITQGATMYITQGANNVYHIGSKQCISHREQTMYITQGANNVYHIGSNNVYYIGSKQCISHREQQCISHLHVCQVAVLHLQYPNTTGFN